MTKTEAFLRQSPLYPALKLETYFSEQNRGRLITITKYLLLSLPLIIIISIIINAYGITDAANTSSTLLRKLTGLALLSFSIYILMHMFEAYFTSIYYFEYVLKNKYSPKDLYTFSAGRILRRVQNDNILTGLLRSQVIGRQILMRLGITKVEADLLLLKQAELKNPPIFKTDQIPLVKVSNITNFIYENHPDFKELLTSHGLDQNDLEATVSWVVFNIENIAYNKQWWTKEKLAGIAGWGTDWSFGRTYLLNKYSRDILRDQEVHSDAIVLALRTRELDQIQAIIARNTGANAILVGLPGQEKMEVIWNLCRKIKNRTATPNLLGKKPLLFLTANFTNTTKDKYEFEDKLTIILNEALRSGNIILVIDNLPKLIIQAKQFELNIYDILAPYLTNTDNQLIALADTEYFHSLIENNQALMSCFETVMIKPLLLDEIIKIISREALSTERAYEIIYTYPAILEIAKSAEYYFPDGVSSDKARDLLAEISPWAVANSIETVTKDAVLSYIEQKTNIPVASINTNEKEKLLNLENLLMKRVVAQREAVFSVSNALRRSRAGIRNEKRPLGSFLFLGPTGVGKTETAKALAEVFFGSSTTNDSEKLLMRLDMSEYQGEDALNRLLGSDESHTQGILVNMLRENPYGVLLLDEFEKTNKKVLNLFLQIIDEGFFSDVSGKKVMARNIMFIATSNAGADKIFDLVAQGKKLADYESEIIAYIVKEDLFKPELLNRFDSIVLFHPLTKENLVDIAKIMLAKLVKKLGEKGMVMTVDKELIDFIVRGGYNPTFGARPMNRLIQDTVEQHLADLIIRDELTAGKTVSFKVIGDSDNKDSLKPIIS